ncbi:hypothetical protein VUR80DRAFT_7273 [Thermomyces stellatus]
MQERLHLKRIIALVAHNQARPEAPRRQRDAVHKPEVVPPLLLPVGRQRLAREAKVEFHAARPLARALAQELPPHVPREAVLRQLAPRGGRPEDGEDERDAAADGLGAVEGGGGGEEEVLARTGGRRRLPRGHGRAVEEDLDGVAGGERGGDGGVGVGGLRLGLGRRAGGRGDGGRAVGAVHLPVVGEGGGAWFVSRFVLKGGRGYRVRGRGAKAMGGVGGIG